MYFISCDLRQKNLKVKQKTPKLKLGTEANLKDPFWISTLFLCCSKPHTTLLMHRPKTEGDNGERKNIFPHFDKMQKKIIKAPLEGEYKLGQ